MVLDDMWTRDAWKSLSAGFPMNEETGSRVLITTRNKEVVSEAHESVYLHPIRPLNDAESWELFKKIVTFGRDNTSIFSTNPFIFTFRINQLSIVRYYVTPFGSDILIPPTDGQLRSLLYFKSDEPWYGKPIRPWFQNFKLLRVLSFEGFRRVVKLPSTIGNLVHLRFFSLKLCNVARFPSSMSKLVCLQTLDLRCFGGFDMKRRHRNLHNVIRHLGQLRHLYLPARGFRAAEKRVLPLATLGNLQTLVNASNYDCRLSDLAGLTNLRKMSIVIVPPEDEMNNVDSETIQFNRLQSLSLESSTEVEVSVRILLSCRNIYKLELAGPIAELPKDLLEYPNLTQIKLYGTSRMDEHIKILEQLPHLKFLWLWYVILENPILVFSKQGFPCLEFLSISWISQLKEWRVEEGAMNCLRRLQVTFCSELKEVPDGLRYIEKLEELAIIMPPEFCSALRKGGKDFDKIKHVASVNLVDISERNKRPDWEQFSSEESTADAV
ncbi:hypothetical protein DVH24_038499 [Malus domestica]|uniref:Uncharacterized protein n=1 Tax=Malus domestica TaxID=3750 RepID=A0A498KEP9_MALDO|nr:hypothetical protein DVH24_038499 [Malus domestica]